MHSPLICIDANATAYEALAKLREHKIRHLPVVENDRIVGILSDRDLQRALKKRVPDLEDMDISNWFINSKFLARDLMSWPVISVSKNFDDRL